MLSKQVPDALMQTPMPKVISLERKGVEGWKSGRAEKHSSLASSTAVSEILALRW